jgi:ATP-dependent Clp protease ATP-binding subunit ClpC
VFERYTEEARRSVFFARYEAASRGDSEIETEHLLLGILKVDKNIAQYLLAFQLTEEKIRDAIAKHRPASMKQFSTSKDVPLSHAAKRALAYGAQESERLGLRNVGAACLLLGLAREPSSLAATILTEAGLTEAHLQQLAADETKTEAPPKQPPVVDSEGFRDLTQLAAGGSLTGLVGRETELRRATEILSRRKRNSVAFIGDPGVGKTALVEGLAQWLISGDAGQFAEYRILQADASSLFPVKPGPRPAKLADEILRDFAARGQTLLCIEGLFDLALARSDWGIAEATHLLSPFVAAGRLQCIATGTPAGLEATFIKAPDLARAFETLLIAAPEPAEASKILEALSPKYEQFHGVSFAPGAIQMAVYASGRFLPQRSLPDRALDLLDEAAARARVRRATEPHEVVALRKQLRQHMRDFEDALARHSMAEAHAISELERAAREKLRVLLEQHPDAGIPLVTPEDIEQVAADRTGAPLAAVRAILANKGPADLDEILARLGTRISLESNPWLPLLAAHIARASDTDIETLIAAIRAARAR